jgi:hypothetical protein
MSVLREATPEQTICSIWIFWQSYQGDANELRASLRQLIVHKNEATHSAKSRRAFPFDRECSSLTRPNEFDIGSRYQPLEFTDYICSRSQIREH